MNTLYQAMLLQTVAGQMLNMRDVSQFSAAEIRQTMADLVAADRMDLASALAAAGQSLYPESEDILAMAGLLAMTREDWSLAIELLQDLRDVQQERTQPMTYRMLARALFCNLDPADAVQTVEEGLSHWPQDADLLAERAAMASSSMALPASGVHS